MRSFPWLLWFVVLGCKIPAVDDDRHHPAGWGDPAAHGPAAKAQSEPCVACHGDDLAGGTAGVSCDACHAPGWRTDCVFCHGGADGDTTGAPPVDLDGGAVDLSFPPHRAHVGGVDHATWTCDACHVPPADVLSDGHVFLGDVTPAVAEVRFIGIAADAAYDGAGTCSNLYCHGDGRVAGEVQRDEALDCGGCHGDHDAPTALSGAHAGHVASGLTCDACHGSVVGDTTIAVPEDHVDGEVDVDMPLTYADGTCTGTCHDVVHDGAGWDGAKWHPAGWDEPAAHGIAANRLVQACTICHGADLTGGTSGQGCDDCHTPGWRTDCTYCHGGAEDTTGAPPDGIAAVPPIFDAHAAHVREQGHTAWGCEQCHAMPEDVLSVGHAFVGDATPSVTEVDFTGGLAPDATYAGGGGCANLYCHGDGQTRGDASAADAPTCGSCHGSATAPGTLSGVHTSHLEGGATCEDCHADTAAGDDTIAHPAAHVDGDVDTAFGSGMVFAADGCTGTCHDVAHSGSTWDGAFHGDGYGDPTAHGPDAKLRTADCTTCHGADLTGGTLGDSCDTCHTTGWRTDCTYCHGGVDNSTGAPPRDLDGSLSALTFDEHTTHVAKTSVHAAFDCDECHTKPTDALDSGHWIVDDATLAEAEVDFTGGRSADGTYLGLASCSNLYCHGDGAGKLGAIAVGASTTCSTCHGDKASGTLSTVHDAHLDAGATCADCHAKTASGSTGIADVAEHVDGELDTSFPSGMTLSGGACTGTCHGVPHDGSSWADGTFHAAGYDDTDEHGLDAKLQALACTGCHGADLTGGTSGTSCDTCHTSGWRTDCTYCHGGVDNSTGAPPDDIDGSTTALTFDEHSAHVETTTVHAAWGCEQCHDEPTSALSSGHLFLGDSTPAEAEVDLGAGLSAAGTYAGGTCSNLYCHGDGASTLGTVSTGATTSCTSCHDGNRRATTLGGEHAKHFRDAAATCTDCHATVTKTSATAISDVTLHVDGTVETSFPSGITYSAGRCTGTCHTRIHSDRW